MCAGQTGQQRSMEVCECVGKQDNGQQAGAGDVLSGGALVGVCLCCWRSAWFVVHSGVVLFVAMGCARMTRACQHSG